MKKLNLHVIYTLSKRLAPIANLSHEDKYSDAAFNLWWAREELEEMVSNNSPLLDVAKRAGRAVIAAIDSVIPRDAKELFKADENKTVGYGVISVSNRIKEFETVLSNEMPSVPAYIVSKKAIYSTEDLIERADTYFSEDVRVFLPVQARKDFCEAGRCLAFELPTACSFHLWRAVEDAMGAYYLALTGSTVECSLKNRNWGATIKALNEQGADQNVTKFLDHIREEYRNPQLHPEEMVDLGQSLALFGAAGSALNQLAVAIQKAQEMKKTKSLPMGESANEDQALGDTIAALVSDEAQGE